MALEDPPVELLVDNFHQRLRGFVDRIGAEAAVLLAGTWMLSTRGDDQELAIRVLGAVAVDQPEHIVSLVCAARTSLTSADPDLRLATTQALANQSDQAAAGELLMTALDDPDEEVRIAAIGGLPITFDLAEGHPGASALLRLLHDPNPRVRDWSTFALGTQTDIDNPDLREELMHLALTEKDEEEDGIDTRAEAVVALARRGDRRVVPLIRNRLGELRVGKLWIEAATELRDHSLHAGLQALRDETEDDGDAWDDALRSALERTRPPADRLSRDSGDLG